MFHISRALAFIATLAVACFVSWPIGLIGLIGLMIVIPREVKR